MKISEQIVLVTGGARGLGLAITHALLDEGARVVVNYHRSHKQAMHLAQHYPDQVLCYQADVTQKDQVNAMFEAAKQHFQAPVHAVINNALIQFEFNGDARPKVEDLTAAMMSQQFEGAVLAALNTTQAALADMKALNFGRIIRAC